MSGGANKVFKDNPATFLRNNVLLVGIQSLMQSNNADGQARSSSKYTQGGLVTVNLDRDTQNSGQKSDGSAANAYRVSEAAGRGSLFSHRFKAYYLPFFNNDFRTMTLGTQADYFFTDTINGCSFVVGAGGHAPKVGHFNMVDAVTTQIDQGTIDNQIAGQFPGGPLHALRKNDYKTGVQVAASLYGLRGNAGWTFYYQAYDVAGYTKMGKIFKIEPNMPVRL